MHCKLNTFKLISNFKLQTSNFKEDKGVTLIELVVVLAVLTVIIGVVVSIVISVIGQQRRVLAQQELLNETSYVQDYISRLAHGAVQDTTGSCLGVSYAGYDYLLTHFDSIAGIYQGIKFITKDNVCQEFFLDTDGLFKEVKDGQAPQPLLSDTFTVKYARFIINGNKSLIGASSADTVQPRVTFSLNVQVSIDNVLQEKIIQTTISQSNLNASP